MIKKCKNCGKEFIGNRKTCSNEFLHIQHSKNNAFKKKDMLLYER